MTYNKAIDILTSQGKFYINLGLERVQSFLELIGNPQKNIKFVHIAGTNGKGSVSAILSFILAESGYKTGLFTSPHVFEYTERIKINNTDIEKETFAKLVIDIVEKSQKNKIHLTEFEILTIAAFKYFAENNVEIVVLETGLGGRLDATNVIEENICSLITHIDLDHTERLGSTIEEIAGEKAGIIKKNCSVVVSKNNLGLDIFKSKAAKNNSHFFTAENAPDAYIKELSLLGRWQIENLGLALKAVEVLRESGYKITEENLISGLNKVKHPCRFEYIKDKNILIDGAHNPNGTKALRESLDFYFPNQNFKFIFGCLKNKKYPQMMKNLFKNLKKGDEIYFYDFKANSCNFEELSSVCEFEAKPFEQYTKDETTLTVICGSFYMIKELLQKLGIK